MVVGYGNVIRCPLIRRLASRQALFQEALGHGMGSVEIATLLQPVDILTLCAKARMAPPRQRLDFLGAHGYGLCEGVGTSQGGKECFYASCHCNCLLRERCLLEPREDCQNVG